MPIDTADDTADENIVWTHVLVLKNCLILEIVAFILRFLMMIDDDVKNIRQGSKVESRKKLETGDGVPMDWTERKLNFIQKNADGDGR